VEANSTGGQGSRRAVAPSDNDDDDDDDVGPYKFQICASCRRYTGRTFQAGFCTAERMALLVAMQHICRSV
jgi:hypothetical protein